MRKMIGIAAAAALLFAAGGANAQSASSSITLSGTAAPTCNIPTTPVASSNTNVTINSSTAAASSLTVTSFIDTAAVANAAALTLTYANAMCNYAHNVGVQTTNGGIKQQSGTTTVIGGTFANNVNYTATATFGGSTATITTNGTANAKQSTAVAGANMGNLVLTVSVAAGTNPVLQGSYSDTLTLQIGAAL